MSDRMDWTGPSIHKPRGPLAGLGSFKPKTTDYRRAPSPPSLSASSRSRPSPGLMTSSSSYANDSFWSSAAAEADATGRTDWTNQPPPPPAPSAASAPPNPRPNATKDPRRRVSEETRPSANGPAPPSPPPPPSATLRASRPDEEPYNRRPTYDTLGRDADTYRARPRFSAPRDASPPRRDFFERDERRPPFSRSFRDERDFRDRRPPPPHLTRADWRPPRSPRDRSPEYPSRRERFWRPPPPQRSPPSSTTSFQSKRSWGQFRSRSPSNASDRSAQVAPHAIAQPSPPPRSPSPPCPPSLSSAEPSLSDKKTRPNNRPASRLSTTPQSTLDANRPVESSSSHISIPGAGAVAGLPEHDAHVPPHQEAELVEHPSNQQDPTRSTRPILPSFSIRGRAREPQSSRPLSTDPWAPGSRCQPPARSPPNSHNWSTQETSKVSTMADTFQPSPAPASRSLDPPTASAQDQARTTSAPRPLTTSLYAINAYKGPDASSQHNATPKATDIPKLSQHSSSESAQQLQDTTATPGAPAAATEATTAPFQISQNQYFDSMESFQETVFRAACSEGWKPRRTTYLSEATAQLRGRKACLRFSCQTAAHIHLCNFAYTAIREAEGSW